ncbi:hypothetical protein [Hymenobacter cheonanensis]|uniref:hypothetical protein n=1 Tax=Hymenobacter sp. CA2-7 TaxID=3063993 RepID=UPI00271253D3|nr:hypothetical protein [Hymenobacter sp. CA2-7]MDO7884661.1 hypothetical protein [Hymenobacter sp. CA2-7]
MEDYAAKMTLKPDAALRDYVTGHAQYREEAVLAALNELRRRGQPAPEDASLRPALEAVVQEQARLTAQALVPAEEEELPRLYSPAGIVVMSAMISVVAGAVLLATNMYRLKRGRAISGLVAFVITYILTEVFLLRWLVNQNLFTPLTGFLLDLPIIMAYVWWFWPRYVGTYQFQARNWLLPLGACLLLKIGLSYVLLHNPTTAPLMKQQMEQMQLPAH